MSKCKICLNPKVIKIYTNVFFKKKVSVLRCRSCGFIFLEDILTEKFINKYYESIYVIHGRFGFINSLKKSLFTIMSKILIDMLERRRLEMVMEYFGDNKKVRILDIGCTEGDFLKKVQPFADTYGTEVSASLSMIAKNKGVKIVGKYLKDVSPNEKFDIITYFHVLEHLVDPIKELNNAKKYLKTNGIIICEFPFTPSDFKNNKWRLSYHFNDCHLNHFNELSTKLMINKCNFEILEFCILQFKSTLSKKFNTKSNAHYLYPTFHELYGMKVPLDLKISSLFSAFELALRYIFGENVFMAYNNTYKSKFRLDLTNEIFFVIRPLKHE